MANETMNLNTPILTLDSDTVLETAQSKADLIWHDIQNAYRTRKILTGILGGIEKTEAGSLIAIIYYKDYRAVIPISEMMINLVQDEAHDYGDISLRQNKVLNNMLGSEIDFVIKGLDTKSRSIVASRKDAMLKKRQIFYFDQDSSGQTKIHEDRIVQARVIAVAEKVVRAEIFGVETSILARDLSFDWLGDARERFQVGEHILVRILNVDGDSPETLSIHADVKSIEHGHLIDEPTMQLIAEKEIWLSMQPFTLGDNQFPTKEQQEKHALVVQGTDQTYQLAKKYNVKLAWGTDLLFNPANTKNQNQGILKLRQWFSNFEILKMVTHDNAELLALSGARNPYPGKLGVIEEDAWADLILVDGDVLKDITLLGDPEKNFIMIMKGGEIYKNRV